MKRFFTAKFVETATFVVVFAIPPAYLEWKVGMVWWTIILSRVFNVVLNAVTLVYSQQFGDWLARQLPTFNSYVSLRTSRILNSLAAILLMQLPATAVLLAGFNSVLTVKMQAFKKPMLITAVLCVVIWAYELWFCPYCERNMPWLARLMKEPVRTTSTAAIELVGKVSDHGKRIHARIRGGSNSR